MRRFLLVLIMLLYSGAFIFSQAGANTRYISVQTIALKDSAEYFSQEIGRLSLGDEVILLEETGRWAQIKAGDLTGWVAVSGLSNRRIVPSGTIGSTTELALAGKGFTAELEIEYRKLGLDYSLIDMMERTTIPTAELLGFIVQGRLARGNY